MIVPGIVLALAVSDAVAKSVRVWIPGEASLRIEFGAECLTQAIHGAKIECSVVRGKSMPARIRKRIVESETKNRSGENTFTAVKHADIDNCS